MIDCKLDSYGQAKIQFADGETYAILIYFQGDQ